MNLKLPLCSLNPLPSVPIPTDMELFLGPLHEAKDLPLSRDFAMNYFTFTALRSADKVLNEQQIFGPTPSIVASTVIVPIVVSRIHRKVFRAPVK